MSLIVQQPNTAANPSDKYRVTDFKKWLAYANGATTSYAFVAYDTYAAAQEAADLGNLQ
jgi:hypothetical protein